MCVLTVTPDTGTGIESQMLCLYVNEMYSLEVKLLASFVKEIQFQKYINKKRFDQHCRHFLKYFKPLHSVIVQFNIL